jgi:hypothetical protein
MKALLEFNLPEDRYEFELASKASALAYALHEIREDFRREIKYNAKLSEETIEKLEELRSLLNSYVEGLPIDG